MRYPDEMPIAEFWGALPPEYSRFKLQKLLQREGFECVGDLRLLLQNEAEFLRRPKISKGSLQYLRQRLGKEPPQYHSEAYRSALAADRAAQEARIQNLRVRAPRAVARQDVEMLRQFDTLPMSPRHS
jgi:hypothetical protein